MARIPQPRPGDDALPVIIDGDAQGPIYGDDADTENAWSQWGEDLKNAQIRGVIRVAKIPTSDDGTPNLTKKGQVQLMSVPHDQYDYDGLLETVRQKFMKPGETIAVRLTGMKQGGSNAGVVPFNRIVMVSRGYEVEKVGDSSQLGEVMAEMRKSQEAQAALLERLMSQRDPVAPAQTGKQRDAVETISLLAGALTPLIAPVIAGFMNRPREKSDLVGMIEAMGKLQAMTAGKSLDNDGDDNSVGGIIKAVAPAGMNLLAALAARQPEPSAPVPAMRPNPAPRQLPAALPVVPESNVVPAEPAPVSPAPLSSEENPMITMLKGVLTQTNAMAANNESPVEAAKLLADMLPEQYDEQLFSLIETPESFSRLRLIDNGIVTHATWYEQLRVALLALYNDDDIPPTPLAS